MRRIALALAAGLLVAACSDSGPKVRVEVKTSEPDSRPGVSVSTRRTVVSGETTPAKAPGAGETPDAGSKDPAPPAAEAASSPD